MSSVQMRLNAGYSTYMFYLKLVNSSTVVARHIILKSRIFAEKCLARQTPMNG